MMKMVAMNRVIHNMFLLFYEGKDNEFAENSKDFVIKFCRFIFIRCNNRIKCICKRALAKSNMTTVDATK